MTARRALVGSGQLALPLPASMVRPARVAGRTVPLIRSRPAGERTMHRRVPAGRRVAGARSRLLVLEVERIQSPRGTGYRVQSPTMQGWAAVAYTPQELAVTVQRAWTEADIAAYARWRGSTYDTPDAQDAAAAAGGRRRPAPRALSSRGPAPEPPRSQLPDGTQWGPDRWLLRPDVKDPALWTLLPNGRLMAPPNPEKPQARRLTYARDSTMGRRILARRAAAGLSVEP